MKEWVHNHFHPKLVKCLDDVLTHDVSVFLDETGIDPGQKWPHALREALSTSCVILTVWCPKYFRSDWCMTEWQTLRHREEVVGKGCPPLVYPIRYSDGEHYHPDAHITQESRLFENLTTPEPVFAQTTEFVRFHQAVTRVANVLAERIQMVPAWNSSWPIIEASGLPPAQQQQPRFASSAISPTP